MGVESHPAKLLKPGGDILPSYKDRQDSLVVINVRRLAVILDKQAQRGAAIPVDFIEQVVSGTMKDRLQAYLAAPTQMYYVMHIAGSWFGPAGGPQTKRAWRPCYHFENHLWKSFGNSWQGRRSST